MGRLVINNKAKMLPSAALLIVSGIMSQGDKENSTCPKFTEINVGKYTYTIAYKKGVGSHIFTIELTEVRAE